MNKYSKALLILAALGLAAARPADCRDKDRPKETTPTRAVATIGDTVIDAEQLDQWIGNKLTAIVAQEYEIKSGVLEENIARLLLEKEAARRGISPAELERREIAEKLEPVDTTAVNGLYDAVKEGLKGVSEADGRARVQKFFDEQRLTKRRAAFARELQAKTPVKRLLEPPRQVIAVADGTIRGSDQAPVTIVMFADFQCPACAQAATTMKEIQNTYGEQVRLVMRDFPLSFHENASKAAEAARCARDQGHYWAMHDLLFANQKELGVGALKKYAEQIGLDTASFGECLDSGRHAADWRKDQADGEAYGVSGTPTIYVNGRVAGMRSLESFESVIDEELARVATAGAKTAQADVRGTDASRQ
jgi:protein-disulfide isomerase